MSQPTADRNLLFGMLAMQMDFITREQLIAAMQAWVFDKKKTLGDILCAQKAFAEEDRQLVDALMHNHLAKHDNNAEKSLTAVISVVNVPKELENIADASVQASLSHVPANSATAVDPYATIAPTQAEAGRASASPYLSGVPGAAAMRYRLVRPHAKGGLGEVFVAHDEELHREVALKEIQDRQADNPDSRTRFMLEAEITGGLEHPGIVPVYGLGAYPDGRPYYAMRFIRGDSLKEAIDRFHKATKTSMSASERALELRSLLGRFVDVCNAIAYAHSRGILHRDLKPANIMLGKFGETLVVDWGLAKPMGQAGAGTESSDPGQGSLIPASMSSASQTVAGSTVGTPQYMSPEQAAGRLDQLGIPSDVYSLGATLYYILTGQPPITDTNVGTVLQRVQRGEFKRPREVNADLAPALEAVCLKAMALKPADRYDSPRLLGDDLEHWLADEPVSAWTEPWPVKAKRWVHRHMTLVTSVVSAIVVALVGLLVTALLLTAANERERQAKQKAKENFELARAAVDTYHTKVSEEDLLKEPGMQPLRKKLLEAAQEYYKKFRAERANDSTVQGELGKATFRLAQITGEIKSNPEAIELHEEAAVLFETLPPAKASPDFTSDQAACYHHLGRLYRLTGKIAKSDEYYDKALKLWAPLVDAHPTEKRYQAGLARTLMGAGNAKQVERALPKAQTLYEKSLKVWDGLAKADSANPEYQRELAVNHSNLAMIFQSTSGKEKDAEKELRAALPIQKKLADDAPNISKYQDDFARTSFTLGSALHDAHGLPDDIEPFLLESAERWQTLVTQHPAVLIFHTRLARAHMALAKVHLSYDKKKAEVVCQKAVAIQRKLVEKDKGDVSHQGELALGLYTLGGIYRADNETDKAEVTFNEAVLLQDKLAVLPAAPPHHQRDLARTYNGLGDLHLDRGREEKAAAAFNMAVVQWKKLAKAHPDDQEYAIGLSATYFRLGNIARVAGRPKDAEPWFTHAVECFDVKNANVLASVQVKTTLSNSYWMRAEVRTKLAQHDVALKDWDRALEYAPDGNKSSIRLPRAAALARAGNHLDAVNEASLLIRLSGSMSGIPKVSAKDNNTLYRFARVYALSATAAKNQKKLADEYAAQGLKLLAAAIEAGYGKSLTDQQKLQNDPDLQVLRDRPEFKRLLSELKLQ